MIGGAILPSLLHQDPRYFYQGTGTTGSRIRHAMFNPFVARGDNGKWQPNYSSLGGDLAASALSNLYYPQADRGAGLVFGNFAIGTAERIGASPGPGISGQQVHPKGWSHEVAQQLPKIIRWLINNGLAKFCNRATQTLQPRIKDQGRQQSMRVHFSDCC